MAGTQTTKRGNTRNQYCRLCCLSALISPPAAILLYLDLDDDVTLAKLRMGTVWDPAMRTFSPAVPLPHAVVWLRSVELLIR